MKITYEKATVKDIEKIYHQCKALIDRYEDVGSIDYEKVLLWIRSKLERSIDEYTTVLLNGNQAGFYHFFINESGCRELDDLYIFDEYQNIGLGTEIIKKCCESVPDPIFLYVFIKNKRAVELYKRHGFEIAETINNSRYLMKRQGRKYYKAYNERYVTAHSHGVSWSSNISTPIVGDVLKRYGIDHSQRLLEIGCGEGRDSGSVLENGYNLLATDVSEEAILYCKKHFEKYKNCFRVLDVLSDNPKTKFNFIFSVAVVHMLVLDVDRDMFYQFIKKHLTPNGIALICTMGDGKYEMQSDIKDSFNLVEREHEFGKIKVAATSCRMVSYETFEKEIERNGLEIIEKGITQSPPDFNNLMYAIVQCADS